MHQLLRCTNCGAATTKPLCAPCTQDRIYEQAQLAAVSAGKGMRCID